jgi:trimeric autotransporter adhesin
MIVTGLCVITFISTRLIAQQDPAREQIRKFSLSRDSIQKTGKKAAAAIAIEKGWIIEKQLKDGGKVEIIKLSPGGIPQYYITDNIDAAISSGTHELWTGGSTGLDLSGNGFIIGEWDGGRVRQLHQEFNNGSGSRITLGDGLITLSDHSTHVAGTLIAEGQLTAAHGMAPSALLHSYDWNEDISEMADEYLVNGLSLSNHSYGFVHGWYKDDDDDWWWYGDVEISETEDYNFGFYGEEAASWDSLAYLCPNYLIVKSAGNDRGSSHTGDHWVFYNGDWVPSNATRDPDGGANGYDCIGNIGVAKNILTVGAVNDVTNGYEEPGNVIMSAFSSWGPTDDGRIKPDIVANGVNLYSSFSANNAAYDYSSGTSMAAPVACGSMALLQDYYDSLNGTFLRASALKALVINTAFECGTSAGPDYSFGWGLLNAIGAADLITKEFIDGDVINVNYLFNTETETYTYYSLGDTTINVTICWTDPAGAANSPALDPTASKLVHDLDLRIISESGEIYYPWVLNPAYPSLQAGTGDNFRDNVEKITISNPTAGDYTIQVSHKGTISGQHYALVISGLSSLHLTNYWTGSAGTGWSNSSNWSLGHAPASPEEVIIPAGCPYYPVLTSNLGVGYYTGYTNICHSLTINEGATMTLSGKDLIVAGLVNISGILYIGDDAILQNGAIIIPGSHRLSLHGIYRWLPRLFVNKRRRLCRSVRRTFIYGATSPGCRKPIHCILRLFPSL